MATNLDVTVNNSQALRALDQISSKLNKIGSDFEGAFSRAGQAAAALSATLLGLGAATAKFADEISDVAAANDMTTASVLGLSKALQQSGGNADSVGRLFQTLANNIEGANSGNEKTVATFAKLGVNLRELGSLGQSEIQGKLFKALAAMPDATERNALAMEIFGKAAMGVDFARLAAAADENTTKYQQFAPALETAGNAFDKIAGTVSDLKVAFAVAFEPIFKYIANLKIEIPDLVKGFNMLAVALAALTSAAVIAGLIKIVDLLKVMSVVVSKNPLIAIAGALLSVGAGVATYLGLTKEQEAAQAAVTNEVKKTGDETKKVERDQSGILDKRQKELDSLTKIRQSLEQNFKFSRSKYDLEVQSLSLNETQKKVAQEQGAIEQQTQQALINLKQANDALSRDAQARNATAYEAERQAIIANGETQKRYAADRITALEQQRNLLRDLGSAFDVFASAEQKLAENSARFESSLMSVKDRLEVEQKLLQVQQIRQVLTAATAQLSEQERFKAKSAIDNAINSADVMTMSYDQISVAIRNAIDAEVALGTISKETAATILQVNALQISAINAGADALIRQQRKITDTQRSFSYGWKKAFTEYVDQATNAAARAERLFTKFTQGLEDAIVGFVKTGKFNFKSFVEDMAEELLRSQIREILASFGQAFGLGNLFGSAGGKGAQAGTSPNNPMYVVSVNGGVAGARGGTGDPLGDFINSLGLGGGGRTPSTVSGGGIGGGGGFFDSIIGIGKSIIGGIGDLFGGFFATGGTIPAGKFGIVGERGPEFVGGPASVTPMGTTSVTYNIQAVDAASFQALVARDPGFIHAVAEMGRSRLPGARK